MKERQKEPSQQKNPRKWGMILLMAVLIIVMLVSLWNILGYLLEGRKSEKFAQDLQESAIIIEKDNTDSKDTKKEKEMIDKFRCRNGNLEISVSRQETTLSEL